VIVDSVVIKNFRAIAEVALDLDALTILLGANSAGKSSVIKALEWFFGELEIQPEDVRDHDESRSVSVRVTFSSFAEADRVAFGGYTVGDRMHLLKTRAPDGSIKLTGRGLVFPVFGPVREQPAARDIIAAYRELRAQQPELDLPAASSRDGVVEAMDEWERQNPERCVEDDRDATHLLGAVGQGVLRQRMKFVLVPAVRDASEEARDTKGSALNRLLAAITEQRTAADQRVAQFGVEVRRQYEELVVHAHGPTLDELSQAMTSQIREFVSEAEVRLEAQPGALTMPGPRIVLEAGEHESLTDIGRQGHGFQRAFVMAALQYLSEATEQGDDAPTIFLAIEEPELYQHPIRARHFAGVLDRLSLRERARVQIMYTTHSPYFVSAQRFASIRLLRRCLDPNGKLQPPTVAQASESSVADLLEGVVEREQMTRRLARTLDANASFCEAFFATAVLLVEGPTDAAVVRAVASAMGASLQEEGIVVCHATKSGLPIAIAVLHRLEIPAFALFDGDMGCADDQRPNHERWNRAIQKLCGVAELEAFPCTQVNETWGAFERNLEEYLREALPNWDALCVAASSGCDWRSKSPETYAAVIAEAAQPPARLAEVVEAVRRLAGSQQNGVDRQRLGQDWQQPPLDEAIVVDGHLA
jgi:putative ATP-dependent endonuclease of OLD family